MTTPHQKNSEKRKLKKGKSPAFQFYAADFLADEKVELMSNEQLGCYIRLISYCWREGSIPSDLNSIAKLSRSDSTRMVELWISPLCDCFESHAKQHSRLVNPRCEREREKQKKNSREKSEAGRIGAKARWAKDLEGKQPHASAIILPMAKDSSSSSISSSTSPSVIDIDPTHPKHLKAKPEPLVEKLPGVWLTEPEQIKLADTFTDVDELKLLIRELSEYREREPRKYLKYKDHYRTLLKWRSRKHSDGFSWFRHPEHGPNYYRNYEIQRVKKQAGANERI